MWAMQVSYSVFQRISKSESEQISKKSFSKNPLTLPKLTPSDQRTDYLRKSDRCPNGPCFRVVTDWFCSTKTVSHCTQLYLSIGICNRYYRYWFKVPLGVHGNVSIIRWYLELTDKWEFSSLDWESRSSKVFKNVSPVYDLFLVFKYQCMIEWFPCILMGVIRMFWTKMVNWGKVG